MIKRTILFILIVLIIVFLIVLTNIRISTASYSVALQNLSSPLRLVLLSDLHGTQSSSMAT